MRARELIAFRNDCVFWIQSRIETFLFELLQVSGLPYILAGDVQQLKQEGISL